MLDNEAHVRPPSPDLYMPFVKIEGRAAAGRGFRRLRRRGSSTRFVHPGPVQVSCAIAFTPGCPMPSLTRDQEFPPSVLRHIPPADAAGRQDILVDIDSQCAVRPPVPGATDFQSPLMPDTSRLSGSDHVEQGGRRPVRFADGWDRTGGRIHQAFFPRRLASLCSAAGCARNLPVVMISMSARRNRETAVRSKPETGVVGAWVRGFDERTKKGRRRKGDKTGKW